LFILEILTVNKTLIYLESQKTRRGGEEWGGVLLEIQAMRDYLTFMEGPPVLLAMYGWSVALAKLASQPMWALGPERSAKPMAYQIHASQWATRAKAAMSRISTAAPYSE
jgi:hypothetical protein